MAKNNLKTILVNEGITQSELSKASGVSAGTINKVFNRKRTPSPTIMNRIVKAVNKISKTIKYDVKDIFPAR